MSALQACVAVGTEEFCSRSSPGSVGMTVPTSCPPSAAGAPAGDEAVNDPHLRGVASRGHDLEEALCCASLPRPDVLVTNTLLDALALASRPVVIQNAASRFCV
jgi:hypothetical protein